MSFCCEQQPPILFRLEGGGIDSTRGVDAVGSLAGTSLGLDLCCQRAVWQRWERRESCGSEKAH